jgi:hypothetical protein
MAHRLEIQIQRWHILRAAMVSFAQSTRVRGVIVRGP